jgi:3-deoxy-D-manno-octulosonate 8-phosphate phosphatase (KDO 8-P phosphatase)
MKNLGIKHLYQGQSDKLPAYEDLRKTLDLTDEQIAYVGDDVVDLPVMRRAGLAIAVQDAHALTRAHADWITPSDGGRGAAREVCEFLMDAQGALEPALEAYLA